MMFSELFTEKAHFSAVVTRYTQAKAFVSAWLLSNHDRILSQTHRADIIATISERDPLFIPTLAGLLDAKDLDAATSFVEAAVAKLKSEDGFIFDVLSKHEVEALWYQAQRVRVFSPQGSPTDNKAHVSAAVARMCVDTARRFAYETRHKIVAALQKAKAG